MHTTLLAAMLLIFLASSCGESNAPIHASMSGSGSSIGNVAVSGGGHQGGTGLVTLFYGTAMENGARRFTYLVAGPVSPVKDEFQDESSGNTTINNDTISCAHAYEVNGVKLSVDFTATHDSDAIVNPILALQGQPVPAEDGWFFLFDWGNGESTPRPVAVAMPELPTDLEEVPSFTNEFVTELMLTNEEVRKFVRD